MQCNDNMTVLKNSYISYINHIFLPHISGNFSRIVFISPEHSNLKFVLSSSRYIHYLYIWKILCSPNSHKLCPSKSNFMISQTFLSKNLNFICKFLKLLFNFGMEFHGSMQGLSMCFLHPWVDPWQFCQLIFL